MATPIKTKRRLSLLGALTDMRDWGSGPGLGGWGAEGAPGASATRPEPASPRRPDKEILAELHDQLLEARQANVVVSVEEGAVTLFGTVPTWEIKQQVHLLAEHVSGVREVSNQLRVGRPDPKTTYSMGSE